MFHLRKMLCWNLSPSGQTNLTESSTSTVWTKSNRNTVFQNQPTVRKNIVFLVSPTFLYESEEVELQPLPLHLHRAQQQRGAQARELELVTERGWAGRISSHPEYDRGDLGEGEGEQEGLPGVQVERDGVLGGL